MSQYRDYITTVRISDTDIIITSKYGSNEISNTVDRDGSMDTNFKAAQAAHRDAFLSLAPSSTSPPCYVPVIGKFVKIQANATVTSDIATVKVPTGNSGQLNFVFETVGVTTEYQVNGGTWTAITTATIVTFADNDTLRFRTTDLAEQEFFNGTITDVDTGVLVDSISLMNSTPTP